MKLDEGHVNGMIYIYIGEVNMCIAVADRLMRPFHMHKPKALIFIFVKIIRTPKICEHL